MGILEWERMAGDSRGRTPADESWVRRATRGVSAYLDSAGPVIRSPSAGAVFPGVLVSPGAHLRDARLCLHRELRRDLRSDAVPRAHKQAEGNARGDHASGVDASVSHSSSSGCVLLQPGLVE